jgi:hypothetical protein
VPGGPVAAIVPRGVRSERRPSELLVAELEAVGRRPGGRGDPADYDVGLTTDDMAG